MSNRLCSENNYDYNCDYYVVFCSKRNSHKHCIKSTSIHSKNFMHNNCNYVAGFRLMKFLLKALISFLFNSKDDSATIFVLLDMWILIRYSREISLL